MRIINERVSQFPNGMYFLFWAGDEILLEATNDDDAIKEGDKLLAELSQE